MYNTSLFEHQYINIALKLSISSYENLVVHCIFANNSICYTLPGSITLCVQCTVFRALTIEKMCTDARVVHKLKYMYIYSIRAISLCE